MLKIVAKGDVELLKHLSFSKPNEIYLSDENCLDKQAPSGEIVCSVHNPTWVISKGKREGFNLSDSGSVGEASFDLLKKTAHYVKKNNYKKLVIHGAMFDREKTSYNSAIKLFVDRVHAVVSEDYQVTLENDSLWFNRFNRNHSLVNSLNNIEDIFNYAKMESVGLTLDPEHFYATNMFLMILEQTGEKLILSLSLLEFEKLYLDFIKNNEEAYLNRVQNFFDLYFSKFHSKINHVHLTGTNFKNYIHESEGKLPLLGEHLPITMDQNDFMDYEYLFYKLLEYEIDAYVVLEVGIRPKEYQIVQSIKNSIERLNKLILKLKSKMILN